MLSWRACMDVKNRHLFTFASCMWGDGAVERYVSKSLVPVSILFKGLRTGE
eukprot:XP_001709919.1 Hypothetical protein GL50803_37866 [Giardia lamblia ATCC 50803]